MDVVHHNILPSIGVHLTLVDPDCDLYDGGGGVDIVPSHILKDNQTQYTAMMMQTYMMVVMMMMMILMMMTMFLMLMILMMMMVLMITMLPAESTPANL